MEKNRLNGKKVLIVDDEPDVLETLEEILEPYCKIETAADFQTAKTLLEDRYFDMAILDIMGVDGYQLLDIANEKEVIAVMLTAKALSPGNVVKSFRKGAASYVPKDEMNNIVTFLEDILEAREKGKSLWWRWLERIGNTYCRKKFGPDWQEKDKEFWEKFEYMRE